MTDRKVVVVGSGLGGMAAAITAADLGQDVTIVEVSSQVGGAAAYSGGQVWIGANHVAARHGIDDSIEETLAYVHAAAARRPASIDAELARQWIVGAVEAARWYEERGVITWEMIPDYPDYYFPDLPGSRDGGRYLTGAAFEGAALGEHRPLLAVSPHFPVGITYGEMFAWGGLSSRTDWDWDLVDQRRADDVVTFGTGIAAAFLKGVTDRSIALRTNHAAVELLTDGERVVGIRCRDGERDVELSGAVILATGAHDWSPDPALRAIGVPPEDGGSVAPPSIAGAGVELAATVEADVAALPAWAAPVLPGYRVEPPEFDGDTGFRACFEHCLPHTFLVNGRGERFADDSFHPAIVAAALDAGPEGGPANLPIFMIWDEQHHQRYGLGRTMPGEAYPPGLVAAADTVADLARALGIPAGTLESTVSRFNTHAQTGEDPDFGRGSNLSVRRFRGDWTHRPNPCVGPVSDAPYYGMRIRLLSTGIAAFGVSTGFAGRVLRRGGRVVEGLHAVGECAARGATGVGYNSGYSLSRAMTFGHLAARDIAGDLRGSDGT